jgi:protein TonB
MSAAQNVSFQPSWPRGLRWVGCFALVLGVHAAAAAALIGHWQAPLMPVADAPPILIDLAPTPATPVTPPSNVTPGPQQAQSVSAVQPVKPAVNDDITAAIPVEKIETLPLPPQPQPALQEVVLPPRKPAEKKERHTSRRREVHLASAPSNTARNAARAVAPAPGARASDPNAVPNWKSAVVARLERYKRYPAEAQARGVEGVAQLAFSVDRGGGVHHARITHSSGSGLLDRATLDLIARAQPLPPPPQEIRGAQIAIIVPIRYNIR